MSRPKQADQWIRTFQVTEPTRHQKGYTIYKVVSKVYPRLTPEAASQITVWKRYNDFKKLHKELQKIHSGLHLKGTFPPFAKSKIIGRFEPEVIEERRLCALQLLEFSAKYPPLFTSRVFVEFLEGGITVAVNELDNLKEPPLQPQPTPSPRPANNESEAVATASAKPEKPKQGPELGGIWKFPQVPENISVSSEDSDERTTFTDTDSTLSSDPQSSTGKVTSSLPEDMLMFDPLLEDLRINKSDDTEVVVDSNSIVNPSSIKSDESLQTQDSWLIVSNGESEIQIADQGGDKPECDSQGNRESSIGDDWVTDLNDEEDTSSVTDSKAEDVESSSSDCAYLYEAAGHISHAQELESEGHYMKAVKQYNTGISILLHGVQGDEDKERKEAVRRKTKKYLRRVKQLYQKHADSQSDGLSTSLSFLSPLRRPISELRLYKVLGVLASSVVLVMHPSAETTYVIKVVCKSHAVKEELSQASGLIKKIPFMVELEHYFETEHALYLLLQHASGGRLWDYVEEYLHSNCGTPIKKRSYSFITHEPVLHTNYAKPEPQHEQEAAPRKEKDSYLDVFSDYVDSLDESKCLKLAKCSFGNTAQKKDEIEEKEERTSKDEHCESQPAASPPSKEKEETNADEGELSDSGISDSGMTNSCEQTPAASSTLLPGVDMETAELIANAQKLLEDIDRTLKETKVREPKVSDAGKPEPVVRSRKSSANDKRRNERRTRRSSSMFERQSSIESCESPTPDGLFPLPPKTHTCSRLTDNPVSRPLVAVYLPEAVVRRWGAEIVAAVDSLHRHGIICRDLNPDNILLGSGGSVLLSYFGNLPGTQTQTRINEKAKAGLYVAPELMSVSQITQVADWWSVGALLYELLTGKSLSACHPGGIWPYTELNLPAHLSSDARSLLTELLRYDQRERLSSIEHLHQHPFFYGVDWDSLQLAAY